MSLRDGETIAVDWHYVVFEDLLDSYAAAYLHPHKSLSMLSEGRLTQPPPPQQQQQFSGARDGPGMGLLPPLSVESDDSPSVDEAVYCRETISINKCLDKFTEEARTATFTFASLFRLRHCDSVIITSLRRSWTATADWSVRGATAASTCTRASRSGGSRLSWWCS